MGQYEAANGGYPQIMQIIETLRLQNCQPWPTDTFNRVVRTLPTIYQRFLFALIYVCQAKDLRYYQCSPNSVILDDLCESQPEIYRICCGWLNSIDTVHRPSL